MLLTTDQTRGLYRKRAGRYDWAVWAYRVAGFRVSRYRRLTVRGLNLKAGDTVVDLACGTGLNFPLLYDAVGPDGRIIGVDLTDAMLEQARLRVDRAGWGNVTLVERDLATFAFPPHVDAVISTLAITLVPEYDTVIQRSAAALSPGNRLAILDLKRPERWPEWLVRFAAWVNKPYGVSLELASRHPWESVRRYLREVEFREFYFGALFLAVGEAPRVA